MRRALVLCSTSVFIQQCIRGLCELRRVGQRHFSSGRSGRTVDECSGSRRYSPAKRLSVTAEEREIRAKHDLMKRVNLFGLRSLTEPNTSHLPSLSPVPLSVSRGVQDVLARFFAEGFEAAAVTAFGMVLGSAPPEERYEITYVDVTFDRPFGFIAVHRPSRLAVVAGWVSSPFEQGPA